MLTITEIEKILTEGLDINEFTFLFLTREGKQNQFNSFFSNTSLVSKGFLTIMYKLTPKGEKILNEVIGNKKKKSSDYGVFIEIQSELEKLTGKKQKTDKIDGKAYSFLPNEQDFNTKLQRLLTKYPIIRDIEKVKIVLKAYIQQCHKANNWFPVLEYYLEKNNTSRFVTDYINWEDTNKPIQTGTISI